jgi:hypothetical protein
MVTTTEDTAVLDFTGADEINVLPDPIPAVVDKSFTLKDFTDCLKETDPDEDTAAEELTDICLRWHGSFSAVSKKMALLAWRTGRVLNLIRAKTPHGEWGQYCTDKLGCDQEWGISKTTIWRFQKLAQRLTCPDERMTLMQAYRKAGIVENGSKSYESVAGTLDELAERVKMLTAKLKAVNTTRCKSYAYLEKDEIDDEAMKILFSSEINLNHALKEMSRHIDYCPEDLYSRFPDYNTMIWAYVLNDGKYGAERFDLDCIPTCICHSDDNRQKVKEWKSIDREEQARRLAGEQMERRRRSIERVQEIKENRSESSWPNW